MECQNGSKSVIGPKESKKGAKCRAKWNPKRTKKGADGGKGAKYGFKGPTGSKRCKRGSIGTEGTKWG